LDVRSDSYPDAIYDPEAILALVNPPRMDRNTGNCRPETGRASLTRRNVGGSRKPGNNTGLIAHDPVAANRPLDDFGREPVLIFFIPLAKPELT
jgi:hypothetical protein